MERPENLSGYRQGVVNRLWNHLFVVETEVDLGGTSGALYLCLVYILYSKHRH
jgi:hypothetical protein